MDASPWFRARRIDRVIIRYAPVDWLQRLLTTAARLAWAVQQADGKNASHTLIARRYQA